MTKFSVKYRWCGGASSTRNLSERRVRNAAHGVAADNRFFVMHWHRERDTRKKGREGEGERERQTDGGAEGDGNLSGGERDGDSLAFVRSQEDGGKTDAVGYPGSWPLKGVY